MNYLQDDCLNWSLACFGERITDDKVERNHRFLEEALELVQSAGCTEDEANQLVKYVFGRPKGEIKQEVGGVMVTLFALGNAHRLNIQACAVQEIFRIRQPAVMAKIRAKQKAKPVFSPLPQHAEVN